MPLHLDGFRDDATVTRHVETLLSATFLVLQSCFDSIYGTPKAGQ